MSFLVFKLPLPLEKIAPSLNSLFITEPLYIPLKSIDELIEIEEEEIKSSHKSHKKSEGAWITVVEQSLNATAEQLALFELKPG